MDNIPTPHGGDTGLEQQVSEPIVSFTATPTATPAEPKQGAIVVGGRSYDPSQLEQVVLAGENARAAYEQAESLLERNESAVMIAEMLDTLDESGGALVMDAIQYALDQKQSGVSVGTFDEALRTIQPVFDGPDENRFSRIRTREMSDDAATVAEMLHAYILESRREMRRLANMIGQTQNYVSGVMAVSEDQVQASEVSRITGKTVTPDEIRQMKANGISDPVKAVSIYGTPVGGEKPSDSTGKTPPYAAKTQASNLISDAEASECGPEWEQAQWAAGRRFENPKRNELAAKFFGPQG